MDLRNRLFNREGKGGTLKVPSIPALIEKGLSFSSLRTKLILPFVLLTLLTALVGVFIVTRLVTSSVRERFNNQMFEAGRVAADEVVRQERLHLEDLRLMSFTQGVDTAFSRGDRDRLFDLLNPLALNSQMDAVTAVDTEGREIISLFFVPEQNGYETTIGADLSTYPLISRVLAGEVDEFGDKFTGIFQTTFGPYLFTSAPVYNSQERLVGVLLRGTHLHRLAENLKTQSLADVVLLDQEGHLLASSMAQPDEGWELLEIDPSEVTMKEDSLTTYPRLFGRDFQAVYNPMLVRGRQIGFLGVLLPSDYVVSTFSTSRNVFSVIFSIGTVGVIVMGYLLAQSIARPLLRLRDMSQAVAAGDLDQESGLEMEDEIGELAEAFDTMTTKLRERTEEAARLYAETVERNRQLAEINERLQRAQAQLIQSEKLAAVGQLTAGIVHDVKNPLAVIKGLAEDLEEEPDLNEYTREGLETIRSSASRANSIVSDLLKFARQSEAKMRTEDLRGSIQASLRLTEYLARKANISFEESLPDHSVTLTYDPQQIEQVLINLINNAIQAMPNGGTIQVRLEESDREVYVIVRDEGIGIPEENLPRIFDPFFTTKPEGEGTGLGLSVSYGIVTNHGGYLEVESEVGKGSTFIIALPRRLREPQQEVSSDQMAEVGHG